MEHIFQNKKGISMIETLAYVVLYGAVMSLITTLVFVLMKTSRNVTAQSILNRGTTTMYTEILSQTINLNPDTVSQVEKTADGLTISITFEKKYDYDDDGKRYELSTTNPGEYAYRPNKITYSYTKGNENIDVKYTKLDSSYTTTTINLEKGMKIFSLTEDNIDDIIKVDRQNESNSYVTFNGRLVYDKKKTEFNFIIPVFTAKIIEGD